MPNKERLPLFVTKLVSAQWESGTVKIEFNAGNEEVHTRYLSKDYARELAFALLQLLAAQEPDAGPPIDDLELTEEGDNIRFTLKRAGQVVMTGVVTKSVGDYARKWLTKLDDGPNVFRLDKDKKKRRV